MARIKHHHFPHPSVPHATPRKPSALEAYLCLACVGLLIFFTTYIGAPIQFGIVLGAAVSFLFSLRLGFTWGELEDAICDRIGKLSSTMLIMWMIGFLLGTMLYSGLLPMFVYYGFQIISPHRLYLSALFICMLMSTMTGSSWSAAGTAGVACMALAHGHGANLAIMAGAVVAGSVFGDKISPMSETTNLAPACVGTDLWSHIKSQLWTTVPSAAIAAVLFTILGLDLRTTSDALPQTAITIMNQLDSMYNWNIILVLPIVVLLVMALLKKPVVPTMLICSLLNLILGRIIQGFNLSIGFNAAITGFKADSIMPAGLILDDKVSYILNRGGMNSMVSVILVCFCGFSMTTILTHTGILEKAIEPLVNNLNTRWKTMLSAEFATLLVLSIGGISYMSSVFVGEAWKKPFLKNGMGKPCLSRTLEDVGTCCSSIIPWCSSAVFFATTLDVPVWGAGGFALYTVLPFVCPIIALLLAIFGIGISPISIEEQRKEIEEIEAEEEEAFVPQPAPVVD